MLVNNIQGFSSFIELFTAINFSLFVYHFIQSKKVGEKENSGLHSLLMQIITPFFDKISMNLSQKAINSSYTETFKNELANRLKKIEI